jgi:hypothetical protein
VTLVTIEIQNVTLWIKPRPRAGNGGEEEASVTEGNGAGLGAYVERDRRRMLLVESENPFQTGFRCTLDVKDSWRRESGLPDETTDVEG